MSSTAATTGHDEIRKWAENRLAFLRQDKTENGKTGRFKKFIERQRPPPLPIVWAGCGLSLSRIEKWGLGRPDVSLVETRPLSPAGFIRLVRPRLD